MMDNGTRPLDKTTSSPRPLPLAQNKFNRSLPCVTNGIRQRWMAAANVHCKCPFVISVLRYRSDDDRWRNIRLVAPDFAQSSKMQKHCSSPTQIRGGRRYDRQKKVGMEEFLEVADVTGELLGVLKRRNRKLQDFKEGLGNWMELDQFDYETCFCRQTTPCLTHRPTGMDRCWRSRRLHESRIGWRTC